MVVGLFCWIAPDCNVFDLPSLNTLAVGSWCPVPRKPLILSEFRLSSLLPTQQFYAILPRWSTMHSRRWILYGVGLLYLTPLSKMDQCQSELCRSWSHCGLSRGIHVPQRFLGCAIRKLAVAWPIGKVTLWESLYGVAKTKLLPELGLQTGSQVQGPVRYQLSHKFSPLLGRLTRRNIRSCRCSVSRFAAASRRLTVSWCLIPDWRWPPTRASTAECAVS